eukprot:TRINITY_DN6495_c0_g1_i1.p3 TRINITY_DN6495_c0_g1~~TRINITY_DN6495_c0_g1_i1.p3  ORF type:complete len:60 (-),score=10.56 TRINITY_DN6495_c0_g1_i1:102-281(-)
MLAHRDIVQCVGNGFVGNVNTMKWERLQKDGSVMGAKDKQQTIYRMHLQFKAKCVLSVV